MSGPLSDEELERLRDGPAMGPSCHACGAEPRLEGDRVEHVYHEEDCEVAQHLRSIVEADDD
jgi:hypothetical protein